MKKISVKSLKKILIVSLVIMAILSILLIVLRLNEDYSDVKLKVNKNEIFTIDDLKLNKLKFGSTEKEIKKELGNPKKEKKLKKDVYEYKQFEYDGIKLLLREDYDDFMLVEVEITKKGYKIGRDIQVGNKISKVVNKFKISNSVGNYMYGNYTIEALKQIENKENIYFGLRNNEQLMYINRDRVDGRITNVAELNIKYKNGKVSKIKWSYDFN